MSLDQIDKAGFAKNAGTAGLLLGFGLGDVLQYVNATGEDAIKK